jgi:hypothetical protein
MKTHLECSFLFTIDGKVVPSPLGVPKRGGDFWNAQDGGQSNCRLGIGFLDYAGSDSNKWSDIFVTMGPGLKMPKRGEVATTSALSTNYTGSLDSHPANRYNSLTSVH